MDTTIGTYCSFIRLSVVLVESNQDNRQYNKYQLLYPYGVPPDDGLYIRPKHVKMFDEIY